MIKILKDNMEHPTICPR